MMYESFAYLYDRLTDDIDYGKFLEFIEGQFHKHNLNAELVLELACGTGSLTKLLSQKGYDVIGLDASSDMLEVAREKCPDTLFINQDMTEFELYGTVDAIICCLDSVNYITDKRKLLKMFKLVNNYLNHGGLFIFDINSEYKLRNIIGNNCFVRNEEDIFYSWENELEKDRVNFYLTFFTKNKEGTFERFDEMHTERIYKESDMKELLKKANLIHTDTVYDFKSIKKSKKSERIFFVAMKE
ncbi:MAG: class I SAM-dependent methyltransferase [Clostridia bacterium]|nr:class I SAM-dependent methyltransferase [Clostridia bacterium]